MSDDLTPQQRDAIDARGRSIALGAGAGCGKTTVLTSRFLGLLSGEKALRLDEIAAVTFTEKAAREMRGRVRKLARGRLASADGGEVERWKSVVRGLESASIQTFHGFCGEILRRFPIEAGVEPDFAILDEAIAPSFREKTLDDHLRDRLADQDPDLIAVALEFGLGPLRSALADALAGRDRAEFPRWAAIEPDEVVAGWVRAWNSRVFPEMLADLVADAGPLLELLRSQEPTHPKMRERRAILLAEIPALASHRAPIASLNVILEAAKVQGGGTAKNWPSAEIYEMVKARFDVMRKSIKGILDSGQVDHAASLEAAVLGRHFARLAAGAVDAFERAKSAAGVLDFDDLILATLALLRDGPPAVRAAVRERCKALLVDEFQDTDPSQGAILGAIAGDEVDAGRLFLVGDVKQSIYGFRGARPEVFGEFREQFRPDGRLVLNRNFRSVPGILHFVNALFAEVFPGADHALEPGRIGDENARPAVEFVWASEPKPGPKPNVASARKVEARWLARLIAGRLEVGWKIREKGGNNLRDANAGDVVYLFRSMADVAAYEQALAAEGLDFQAVGGSAFYAQQEVIDLINLLAAIEDPLDEVSLAGALRGPFFCVSDDALYWLAAEPGGLPGGFENWRRVERLNGADEDRVRRAHALISRWRRSKDRVPIAALIDSALGESGAEASLLGEFLGSRKRANVRKLARLARRFDLQGGYSLADFVARLRADFRKPPREEQAATTDEESKAVRLMSIHQAKGLEFPIVVVPDLDRKSDDPRSSIAAHPEIGLVVKPPVEGESSGDEEDEAEGTGNSLGWTLHRRIAHRQGRDESHRLLYVATTRAMDHLILSAAAAPEETPHSHALKLLSGRFDRGSGRRIAPIPDDWAEPSVGVVVDPPPSPISKPSTRRRPDLLKIAGEIRHEAAHPAALEAAAHPRLRPRFVDLDPTFGLPPFSTRLDRLIRSALADPMGLDPRSLETVLARVGRAQEPAASPTLMAQAIDRLAPWVTGPLARSLAKALEIRRAVSWSIAWPSGSPIATVFRGVIDFASRDSDGLWRLVSISDAQSPEAVDRLRTLLPAFASTRLGLGPIRQAWRVRLGPGGGSRGEDAFGEGEIERAIEDFFAL